jgi:hypothetical protein
LQQLLRDWESRVHAGRISTARKLARARTKPEDHAAAPEPAAEPVFIASPCDECSFRRHCATGLACERYSMFLDGNAQKRWAGAPCEPTQARFEALFN